MRKTMDRTGRVVIPAAARAELRLRSGHELDVRVADGGILELEPIEPPVVLVDEQGLLVLGTQSPTEPVTDDDVRTADERVRAAGRRSEQ